MANKNGDLWKAIGFASYISTYVAVTIVLTVGGGYYLDRYLNTLPLFTIIGLVLGFVSAFYGVYKLVMKNGK